MVVSQRVGSRAEVWFANAVAAFMRYVAERVAPISVPMMMRQDAIMESFEFAKANFHGTWPFLDRFQGLRTAIAEAQKRFPDRRQVLEFGVFRGQMINYQAKQFPDLLFVGFDSFEGLAEAWTGVLHKGAFDLRGRPPRVRRNVALVKGWFRDTLPGWKIVHKLDPGPLLVHIDCDTYEATVDVLRHCAEYVTHGVVLHFDDYYGHPNWKHSGHKALQEIAAENDWKLTYLCYGTKEVGVFAEPAEHVRLD